MKKLIPALCVIVLIFGFICVGYCEREGDGGTVITLPAFQVDRDQIPYESKPINKLERGVINIATFWMELPAEVAKVTKEQDPAAGVTIGAVNGVITSAVRGLTGIYDTFTFFLPSYTKPAMKPEYAWKAADDKIRALFW